MYKRWSKYTALGWLYVKMFLAFGKYAVRGGRWAGLLEVVVPERLTVWEVWWGMSRMSKTTQWTISRSPRYYIQTQSEWTKTWSTDVNCEADPLCLVMFLTSQWHHLFLCLFVCLSSHLQLNSTLCTGSFTLYSPFPSAKAVMFLVLFVYLLGGTVP